VHYNDQRLARHHAQHIVGETKEGQWIARNAHRYGFIIRYPKGKEQITGYQHHNLTHFGARKCQDVHYNDQRLARHHAQHIDCID
jgi:hypothetical protein